MTKKIIDDYIEIGFQCAICGRFAPTYDEVRKHALRRHSNQEEKHVHAVIVGYGCQHCKIFKRSYPEMKEHVRTMHNELVTDSPRHRSARGIGT